MSKRTRSEKGKAPQTSSHSSLFVSSHASCRHILTSTRSISSGRSVVINDFEHLNLAPILRANSLENYLLIREPVYPSLVHYFYSNLSFESNQIRSRVLGKDIDISLQEFAHLLHLSCEGEDIFNLDLHNFVYPDGESALTASTLLHGDDNPALVRNEEVRRYTLTAQVLAKIVFYNLLPKSGEYSHARGSAPLLIYCLLRVIRVNIPKLIISVMTSDSLLVPTRHLPFGMVITYLLKQLNFNLSNEQSIEPSVDLNNTLLKRMRPREHPPAPPPSPFHPAVPLPGSSSGLSAPPDPYAALSTQIREHISAELTAHRQQIFEEMSTHYHNLENDMSYICDSIRYMESRLDDIYLRREWAAPVPSPHARPLPTVGPPFPARTPSSPPQPAAAQNSDEDDSDEDDEDASDEDASDE